MDNPEGDISADATLNVILTSTSFGVLHTCGRHLQYHPHIHYIVSGGAISKIFRAKFRDEMKKSGLLPQIPADICKIDWNVNSQAIGNSETSIKCLAPYVFKVAISDHHIDKVDGRDLFIRRFLQHVLPTGFMKVRHYGFLNSSSSIFLDHVRRIMRAAYNIKVNVINFSQWIHS